MPSELEISPENPQNPIKVHLTVVLLGRGSPVVHETKAYANDGLTEMNAAIEKDGEWRGEFYVTLREIFWLEPVAQHPNSMNGAQNEYSKRSFRH